MVFHTPQDRIFQGRVAQQITAQMILLGLLASARVTLPNCADPFKKSKEGEETFKDNQIRSARARKRNTRTKKMKRERNKENGRIKEDEGGKE